MEKRSKIGLGTFVCIFNRDFSKILLIKRNKEKRKQWRAMWGNVGGRIEVGETSMQACIREISEEIGLQLKSSDITLIYVKETPDFLPHTQAVHFVYATIIDENSKITLNNESDGYGWFSVKNLPTGMLDSKKDIFDWLALAKKSLVKKCK